MQLIIYISILFLIAELLLLISKRAKQNQVKSTGDKKSLLLFWILIPVGISLGFLFANYQVWNNRNLVIASIGVGIFVVGVLFRWISIFQLKKGFTVNVSIGINHHLKKDGLYTLVRHPSYLGLVLIILGLSIATNSLVSILVMNMPILFAIFYRILIEEKMLTKEFGEAYVKYCEQTKRIFPLIY